MRRLVPFLLCLATIATVWAQDVPVIATSQAVMAVRIKNPLKLRTAYKPIVDMFTKTVTDNLPPMSAADKAKIPAIDAQVTKFLTMPGLNGNGEFWFLTMPTIPPTDDEIVAYEDRMAQYQEAMENYDMGAKTPVRMPIRPMKPMGGIPVYVLLPVTDQALFMQIAENIPELANKISMCDMPNNYCVLNMGNVPINNPNKLMVKFDQPIISTCDVVMVSSMKNQPVNPMNGLGDLGSMAMVFAPVMAYQQQVGKQLDRAEIGFTVKGNDMSMETYVIPTAGSDFANSLVAFNPTAAELKVPDAIAAAMPKDLAMYSAQTLSPEGLNEMTDQLFDTLVTPMLGFATEANQAEAFGTSLKRVMALCENGGGVGITNPNKKGVVNMVSICKIADSTEAQTAVRDFTAQLIRLKDGAMAGMVSKLLDIEYTNGMLDDTNTIVDEATIIISTKVKNNTLALPPDLGGNQADVDNMMGGGKYKEVYRNYATIAFQDDRMIVVMGPNGKEIVDDIINRARLRTQGFASTPHYQALKKYAPAGAMSFQTMSTLDMANVLVSILPAEAAEPKAMGQKMLQDFKPQINNIVAYTQIKDGQMYGEMLIPAEQISFVSDMVGKFVKMFSSMNSKPVPAMK